MFTTTINSVLSDISYKIGQLRELAEKHDQVAAQHTEKAQYHNDQHQVHVGSRDRATRIAIKFEELLK